MATTYKGLTIKFGADAKGLTSALREATRGAQTTQRELKKVDSALKMDPSNVKLTARQVDLLKDRVREAASELDVYRQAEEQIGKDGMSTEQWKKLQADIAMTEQKLSSYKRELSEAQIKIAAMDSVLGSAGMKVEQWGTRWEGAGRRIQSVGRTLSMTVTPAAIAVGAATVKAAVDIDTALTGVKKTVDGTEEQYQQLKAAAVEFSETNAVSATQILDIQALGAQLGFAITELDEFSRVVSGLDIATNMDAETAATEMAQFANITKMSHDAVSNYGSAIVGLGNNFATTESDISHMAMRLAAAGTQVGMSQADILGLATALTSMGMEAEAGGTAMSTIMSTIDKAVASNDSSLKVWASTAKMSASEFADAWKSDPVSALSQLLAGMEAATAEGGNMSLMLDELGITSLRQTDAMKRLAGNSEFVAKAVAKSNEEWNKNTALQAEVDNRNASLAAKFEILKNRVIAIAERVGGPLADALLDVIDAAEPLIQTIADGAAAFADMDEGQQRAILTAVALSAAIGPLLTGIGAGVANVKNLGTGMQSLAQVFARFGGAGKVATDTMVKGAAAATSLGGAGRIGAVGLGALKAGFASLAAAALLASVLALVDAVQKMAEKAEDADKSSRGMRSTMESATSAVAAETKQMDGLAAATSGAVDAVDSMLAKQADLADSMAERNREAAQSGATLQSYADTISELAGQTDLSEEAQARLRVAVDAVNQACGTSYEVSQNAAGAYVVMANGAEQTADAVLRVVEAQKAQIAAEAAKSNYEDAMKAKAEAAEALAKAQEELAAKQAWANEQAAAGLTINQYQADEIVQLEQKVRDAEAALDGVSSAEAFANDQMTLLNMAMEEGADAYTRFAAGSVSLQAGIEQSGGSLASFRSQLAETGVSIEALTALSDAQLVQLGASYDGTAQSIVETLQQLGVDMGDAGSAAGKSFTDSLSSEAQAAVEAAISTVGMTRDEFDKLAGEAGIEGDEAAIAFANSLAARSPDAQAAAGNLKDSAESGVDGTADRLGSEAQSSSSQFARGLITSKSVALTNANAMADAAQKMNRDVGKSKTWGSDLGSNFAAGIRSAIDWVAGAANSLADAVKAVLGHSIPEAGPLRNSGKGEAEWGQHSVENYIRGMRSAMPQLERTADEVAAISARAFGASDAGLSVATPDLAAATRAGSPNVTVKVEGGVTREDVYVAMAAALADMPAGDGGVYLDDRQIGRYVRGKVMEVIAR